MKRPVFKRFGELPRFPAALWLLIACLAASLLFMLFQGGKLASMLIHHDDVFIGVFALWELEWN